MTQFFIAKIKTVYDGKEFPHVTVVAAQDRDIAEDEIRYRLEQGDFSFDSISEIEGGLYWSECGAHVASLQSLTEITETTYNEMKQFI